MRENDTPEKRSQLITDFLRLTCPPDVVDNVNVKDMFSEEDLARIAYHV
jgi:hypothetical protein